MQVMRGSEAAASRLARFRSSRGLEFPVPAPDGLARGEAVHVSLRPERCRIAASAEQLGAGFALAARVEQVVYLGSVTQYLLELEPPCGERGLVEVQNAAGAPRFVAGDAVVMGADPADCLVLAAPH